MTLDEKTKEIAKRYGCDRSVFAVCWVEDAGGVCVCKTEARAELAKERAAHKGAE